MKRIRPGALIIGIAVIFALVYWGLPALLNTSIGQKIVPSKEVQQSMTVAKVDLPNAPKNIATTAPVLPLPTTEVANLSSPQVNFETWAWNAHMGFFYAIGGTKTMKGSIYEKRNININLTRNDDNNKMQADLIKFAQAYHTDKNTIEGTHFITNMGDGDPSFLYALNNELSKIDNGEGNYIAQIVGSFGRSLGEDKFMGLPEWKEDPQKARGCLVAAVLRDGDWNIVIKWASDNGIPVNPDEHTYDADAINFVNADTYIDAAQKYIIGYSEDRKVVKNGKIDVLSGTKHIAVNGVATWTPGDVMVAEKKGGLISIVSTAEYASQMPCVLIGIKQYMKDNPKVVENILAGAFEGADQVKGYSSALNKAGEISYAIYKEESPKYWVDYYKGQQKADKQSLVVSLGGSRVNNLADNMEYFGLNSGSTNIYEAVYKTFGDVDVSMYPKLIPSYPKFDDVVDLSYLKSVASTYKPSEITAPDLTAYNTSEGIREKTSQRSWAIQFNTGKATFTSSAITQLEQIKNQALISSGLQLRIEGHTDNVGSDDINIPLSQARADAVKQWLESQSPSQFRERITAQGFGATQPIANNSTEAGKTKNRRVEIVMGK